MAMLNHFRKLAAAPTFPEDKEKTRKARYANTINFTLLGLVIGFEAWVRQFAGYRSVAPFDLVLAGVAVLCAAGLILLRRGHVRLACVLLVALLWLASNGIAAAGFGARDASFIVNFAVVLMAALLLGWQAALIVTFLSIASGFTLAYAEQNGLIGPTSYPVMAFVRDMTFVFGLNGVLIYLLIQGLENALRRSQSDFALVESANVELSQAQRELQNRTADLLDANRELEDRAHKLQATAMVARTVASIQDLGMLLASVARTISKEFGYHHVRLFLLDEERDLAILRSTNVDAEQKMLGAHRTPVLPTDPLGFVAQTGQPRLVGSVGQDSGYLHHGDFPASKSALLLPLKYGNQVIGVLDIRSPEANAFSEVDLPTFTILGDQVAMTIQNLILYDRSQIALSRADIAAAQTSARAWRRFEKAIQTKGYRYDGIRSEPLGDNPGSSDADNLLNVPLQLRGQTLGSFKLTPADPARSWTDDELWMANTTAERVAWALEGARLLAEAQTRAKREAFLADVATKLSASFRVDSILRDTIQELGQVLRNSTITFQLVDPANSSLAPEANSRETTGDDSGATDE